jgi:endoglucanase
MYVTDIKDGGFLTVSAIGGLDTRILQGAEVIIYGKKVIYGVIASTPPHLQKPEDEKKLCAVADLFIDTGYEKDELSQFVRVGTPVGYKPFYTELKNERLAGKGFDNKACVACAVYALSVLSAEQLCGDVYLLLSAHEETVRSGGAVVGGFNINPDYAMVVDVNLGATPDTKKHETVALSDGVSITLSAVTDRRLTAMTIKAAEENSIKYQKTVSPARTGTNATSINLVRCGIPVVDIGLPLRSMHTYSELISLDDAEQVANLIAAFVCDREIAEVFKR